MSQSLLFSEGTLVALHTLCAFGALVLGVWQFVGAKGTSVHRAAGYVWTMMMVFTAASSLWIHQIRLLGPFSPIHLLSVLVLFTAPLAVVSARAGRIALHRKSMRSLMLFGLIAPGLFTLLPGRLMNTIVFGVQ